MTRPSQTGAPRIDPADLRDHADEARIARIWTRIDADLPETSSPSRKRSSLAITLVAAAIGLFGCGLLTGKLIYGHRAPDLVATRSNDVIDSETISAGGTEKTYPLSVGGQITLSPGTIVDVERRGNLVNLQLLQGEASLDTAATKQSAVVEMKAGDATLNTQSGSAFKVRLNQNDMDVDVSHGAVSIKSGPFAQRLVQGQHADKVPVRVVTASLPQNASRQRNGVMQPRRPTDPPVAIEQKVAGAQLPEWRVKLASGDHQGATEELQKQPGGINGAIQSASSVSELMLVYDAVGTTGNADISCAQRVLRDFPQSQEALWAKEKLDAYYGRVCKQMTEKDAAGQKAEAGRLASEYASNYPNGPCLEAANRIKSDVPASDGSAAPSVSSVAPPAAPSVSVSAKPAASSDKPLP